MTTIQLLDKLKSNLSLLEWFNDDIEIIKASHLAEIKALQPKPKKVIPKKPKERPIKVEITEAGKTTEVIFQTEKECDTFLKLKQKQRLKTAQSPTGLKVPTFSDYGGVYSERLEKYKRECAEYWQAAENENLTFKVLIEKV